MAEAAGMKSNLPCWINPSHCRFRSIAFKKQEMLTGLGLSTAQASQLTAHRAGGANNRQLLCVKSEQFKWPTVKM